MSYNTVIFDLDGTLLDTLDDLWQGVNTALAAFGFPLRTKEEVRSFVGDGVAKLMERAVPAGTEPTVREACLKAFKETYAACCKNNTRPYPHILTLLSALKAKGIQVAIVSNKFDQAVKALSSAYFGDLIQVAVGEREVDGIRKKPAPDTVFEAMRLLDSHPDTTVYVGDSDVDIFTAENAGIPCLSVTWGFRDEDFLLRAGAQRLVREPYELLDCILA